ncbi:nucleotidyltransferase domain-containing protein [Silvimonas iriomotensis]|uniref:Nucleotidyltransferase n=1 Tax=Silvimonas iriomotensis TaxID=449662 RepID=A0ABQ2P9S6_9NEIS|nr:nucleotidyltransferase [Silvimonas iriomotensis]GGP21891.1 hypothetical protein GCM10010970_22720 [Silvimonas iriomotensis]
MTTNRSSISLEERVLSASTDDQQKWQNLIFRLLRNLELDPTLRKEAEDEYQRIGRRLAEKLDVQSHEITVFAQGSMSTQTTVPAKGNTNFDLDVVAFLHAPKFNNAEAEALFHMVGNALKGDASAGEPEERRRCWKLPFPGKRFYFDITPAKKDLHGYYSDKLLVRDVEGFKGWSPSNPAEFTEWFNAQAELEFRFTTNYFIEARGIALDHIEPLPQEPVSPFDVLRRTVQLMKLHRDHTYWEATPERKKAQPISVILVTLAAKSYEWLYGQGRQFATPLELVFALVAKMRDFVRFDNQAGWCVENPVLPMENFAERWNDEGSNRADEFGWWHDTFSQHLSMLFDDEFTSARHEEKLRKAFGGNVSDAWRAAQAKPYFGQSGQMTSLRNSLATAAANATQPLPTGAKGSNNLA